MTHENTSVLDIEVDHDTSSEAYVRLANSEEEIERAQRLRYQVFYEEYGATPSSKMRAVKRDFDEFDKITDHLIVLAKDPSTRSKRLSARTDCLDKVWPRSTEIFTPASTA